MLNSPEIRDVSLAELRAEAVSVADEKGPMTPLMLSAQSVVAILDRIAALEQREVDSACAGLGDDRA